MGMPEKTMVEEDGLACSKGISREKSARAKSINLNVPAEPSVPDSSDQPPDRPPPASQRRKKKKSIVPDASDVVLQDEVAPNADTEDRPAAPAPASQRRKKKKSKIPEDAVAVLPITDANNDSIDVVVEQTQDMEDKTEPVADQQDDNKDEPKKRTKKKSKKKSVVPASSQAPGVEVIIDVPIVVTPYVGEPKADEADEKPAIVEQLPELPAADAEDNNTDVITVEEIQHAAEDKVHELEDNADTIIKQITDAANAQIVKKKKKKKS